MALFNNNITNTDEQAKRKKRKKIVLIGLGVLATTALTFFGIHYWKKSKKSSSTKEESPDFSTENPEPTTFIKKPNTASSNTSNTTKANYTKPKQNANHANHANNNQTKQAENVHKKVAETIKDFKAKYKSKVKTELTPILLAKGLQLAYLNYDFLHAYKYLKLIHSVKEYVTINKYFEFSLVGRTRKTIVTAMLEAFKTENARKLLFTEFKRIGLKQRGSQWALGEVEGASSVIITTQATKVWKTPKVSVNVPSNMILGREVSQRGAFTVFENQNIFYLVESNAIAKH